MKKEIKIKGLDSYTRKLADEIIENSDNMELLRTIKYFINGLITSVEQLEQNESLELWEDMEDLSLGYDENGKECYFSYSELTDLTSTVDTINDILINNKVHHEKK